MPRKKSQPPAAETNGVNSGALEMVSFTVTVDTDTEAGRRIIAGRAEREVICSARPAK